MTQPATTEQLLILVERAERGRPLTADETALLRAGITEQQQRAEQLEELLRVAHDTSNRSETERARAVQRAERAEAEAQQWREATGQAIGQLRQAEAAIERVRRIHTRGPLTDACNDCGQPWHCPTIRALDERQQP